MTKIRSFSVVAIAFALLLCSLTDAQAQKSGVSLHLGGILPLKPMSEDPYYLNSVDPSTNGSAMFGASLGLRYNYRFINTRIEDLGLGIFISADLMWNALNKDVRDAYDFVAKTKPMYVNVPIVAGLSYTSTFSDIIAVWGEVGVGCDLFQKTTEGWKNMTTSYKMDTKFAVEAGVGVMFIDLISIGVHYYWLGNHDVVVATGLLAGTSKKLQTGQMAFKLGFHF